MTKPMPQPKQPTLQPSPDAGVNAPYGLDEAEQIIETLVEDPATAKKVLEVFSTMYRGPTPPPGMLKEYERLSKGSAARFLEMIPAESEHRRKIETRVVRNELIREIAPLVAGLLYAAMMIIAGLWFMVAGHAEIGGALIGTTIVGGIAAFCFRDRKPKAGSQSQ